MGAVAIGFIHAGRHPVAVHVGDVRQNLSMVGGRQPGGAEDVAAYLGQRRGEEKICGA